MVVSEGAISNIMGGMENTAGVRLHSHRHKLKQRFDIIRKLGQGTYGKVQLAVNKDTGQEVAIKTIKKAKIETEQDLVRIRREIQIMSSVQHPQIIHIFEVFENREKMVLVMEYAAGGELYDYLSERKVLSVEEARRVFRQVASAVYYCHKHKICHRDLKLENILLDIEGNAKIADFGLSNVFDEKRRLDTFCGSPLYASPEIVKGVPYIGPEVDCWSLGVLLYTLVYGAMPFDGSNFKRLVKQITQGDFYEPPSPSSASPLIRSMLTVAAEKRANIAEICSHWWVNDGEAKSCLDEAETLANQTPVRLDLLLSLAPKHISSEHMVIQPEEEDNSQRSDDGQSASPNIQLPPPPPVPPPPNGAQSRSLSMGAIDASAVARDADLVQPPTATSRRDEEKRRLESETPSANAKKIKESTSSEKPPIEGEKKKVKKTSMSKDTDKDKPERKKSSRKKESFAEAISMEVDEQPPKPKKKSVKKMDSVEEKSISDETEKPEKKKVSKKKESVTAVASKDGEKKRSVKKKEPSVPKSNEPSRESTPKAPSPQFDLVNEVHKAKRTPTEKYPQKSDERASSVRSPSNKSVISAISTDGTLKASDSSISTRHSVSPSKSVIEVDIPSVPILPEPKPPTSSDTKASASSKPPVESKVSKAGSGARVSKATSAKTSKNSSSSKISTPVINGSDHDLIAPSTEQVLKDTVTKIKQESPKTDKSINESIKQRKVSSDNVPATESTSSKDSSQHSSVVSTPARSRTGSESSSDTKSGRQDSRRGSKVFSKAAMWDSMFQQQQGEKPPATVDKGRKAPRPGGLNMNDLTKKFEEKPPAERKKPVVGSVKISDVKKSFENKSSDKVGGFRRTSTDGSNDSITSRKDGSLPVSPTRLGKRDDSLPPAGKTVRKISDVTISKEKEIPIQKELSPEVAKVTKEKPGTKTTEATKVSSPVKETSKKDKSPEKEPPSRIGMKRDVGTPKRASPVKDKPKAVSIAIKKVGSTHSKPAAEKPEKEKPIAATSKTDVTGKKASASKFESSDSSDSESEAERLLRQLSERRERIEAAKNEKLRKVSQQQEEAKERISRPCMDNVKTDERKSKGTLPPLETPSDTPDDMIPVKPAAIPQASMKDAEQPSGAKFATLPRGFKSKASEKAKASLPEYDSQRRKKSEVEIVLNNSSQNVPNRPGFGDDSKRASYAEIQLAAPQQEYKTEVRHSIAPSPSRSMPMAPQQVPTPGTTPPADSSLQRAPRERIIPIMMEDNDEEEDDRSSASNYTDARTASNVSLPRGLSMTESPFLHSPLFKGRGPLGGVFGPTGGGLSSSRASSVGNSSIGSMDQQRNVSSSHEPIRKSRRERIIPICVEGEGTLEQNRPPPSTSQPTSKHGMGRRLTIERPDSLSSNDEEEEEEDEDDGFHNLTAESLFSTLLNRVRNLTKNRRITPLHHQMGFHHSTSPFSSGIHSIHSPLRTSQESFPPDHGGFWSSLYSPPRELSRQCSEASTDSRGGERGTNKGSSSSWGEHRTLSREMSQESAGVNQASGSDQSTPYNTLPRGWRTRLSGGDGTNQTLRHVGEEPPGKAPNETGLREKSRTPSGEASGQPLKLHNSKYRTE